MKKQTFNRTILELKYNKNNVFNVRPVSFNRTILELKLLSTSVITLSVILQSHHTGIEINMFDYNVEFRKTFNRTILELK